MSSRNPFNRIAAALRRHQFSDLRAVLSPFDAEQPVEATSPPREGGVLSGCIHAAAVIAVATLATLPLRAFADLVHLTWIVACLYLALVGAIAWIWGTYPAVVASLLAFGAINYFYTFPFHSLGLHHPVDLLELLTFLATAAFIGAITGQLRQQRIRALNGERVARTLASIAGRMSNKHAMSSILNVAVESLEREPGVMHVVIWMADSEGRLQPNTREGWDPPHSVPLVDYVFAKTVAVNVRDHSVHAAIPIWPSIDATSSPMGIGTLIPIVSGDGREGVLQIFGRERLLGEYTEELAVSVTHLLAIFCEGARAVERANQRNYAEEAQRVKSAIVSAVTHELKSPLATVVAGVTDLLSEDVRHGLPEMRATLKGVAAEVRRLETAIGDLVDLSRLQSEEWMPHPGIYESGEILGNVVASVAPALYDRICFPLEETVTPSVYVDFDQIHRALKAIIDNAVCYSPENSEIRLGAERVGDRTMLWVEDEGPGVSEEDKPFVFDKAYRGEVGVMRPGGTGLGLTIVRDLVEINHGQVLIEDVKPNGTRIVLDLPAVRGAQGDGSEWSLQES